MISSDLHFFIKQVIAMRIKIQPWLMSVLVAGMFILSGCLPQQPSANPTTIPSASPVAESTPSPTPQTSTSPSISQFSGLPRLEGKATVEMRVKGATVTMEIDGTDAPITAGNFVDLVKRGVYDGLMFHRVVREPDPFVVQGGDPQSKDSSVPVGQLGTGNFVDPATKVARYVPLEITPEGATTPIYSQTFRDAGISALPKLKHTRGAVAMARSQFPDSASAQFYITLADVNFLDGSYAVFGTVTKGMEVVDKIQQGDRIDSIKVTQGIENLKLGK